MKRSGALMIAEERDRQITQEGWTPRHDDNHDGGEMAMAAACYALSSVIDDPRQRAKKIYNRYWPWTQEWWKPKDPIRDLVRAGALLAAEIDRLQRLEGQ